jgi:acetyl esterase/lipase
MAGGALALAVILTLSSRGSASEESGKPPMTVADEHYGSDARQVFDLWLPASAKPAPLVVFIHGGAFLADDKSIIRPDMLKALLASGFAVAAINYRYASTVPLPGPMLDAGRAVQYLRFHAGEWNLDPGHVALIGGSAGAGIALWLAFHDDLAQSGSADPVLRESSKPSCAFVWDAQTSYDPRFIRRHVGGRLAEHPAVPTMFGLKADELDTPRAHALYQEASPIEFVRAGMPPVFLFYSDPDVPLPPDADSTLGAHHPAFGRPLREKALQVGGICILRHKDDYDAAGRDLLADMCLLIGNRFSDISGICPSGRH